VRNGLGTIAGYARMLERASLAEDPAAAARSIREECETLETVVRRFTDFVKLETLQLAETDLARLLARVVAREARAREEVETRLVGLDAPLAENLVRNAVQAAATAATSRSRGPKRGHVELHVEDDGPASQPTTREVRPLHHRPAAGRDCLSRKIVLRMEANLSWRTPCGSRHRSAGAAAWG
jgi:signal transduction histidine kinase